MTDGGSCRCARALKGLIVIFLVGGVVASSVSLWIQHALAPVDEIAGRARSVSFEVEPGDSLGQVASALEGDGLIRSAWAARWFAEVEKLSSKLKVGEYQLSSAQSTREILETLAEGRVRTYAIVIPEGQRAREIATRLAAAGLADPEAFLAVVFDPESPAMLGVEGPSLEGYLFPDTYQFERGLTPRRIAQKMVQEFLNVYRELGFEQAPQAFSMREIVTLASIVEKETGAAHERPLIAAVFLNRLKRGMRLETDPTVIYGIENFDGNLRRVHLEDDANPYNTYRIRGLPPGPIANPGRDALLAVQRPADTDYLYFVSRNDGTHVFSETYVEHEASVDRFQRQRRRQ